MRFKPQRIALMSRQITKTLLELRQVEAKADAVAIESAIRKVITRDMAREDEIEKEAAELLRRQTASIDPRNIDMQKLLSKAKSELARRKGVIL